MRRGVQTDLEPPCRQGSRDGVADRSLPVRSRNVDDIKPRLGMTQGRTQRVCLLEIDAVADRTLALEHRELPVQPIQYFIVGHDIQSPQDDNAARKQVDGRVTARAHSSSKLNWIQPMRVGLVGWLLNLAVSAASLANATRRLLEVVLLAASKRASFTAPDLST